MNNKPMFETQSDYELPLLQLLYTLPNGGGKVSEILPRFEEKYRDQIPQKDYKNFESGGMRWEKNVQWCRYYLKERGFLDAPRRGIWQITDEGRRWVEENPKANRLPSFRREKPAQLNPIIKAITIENFRSIRHFTFDLEPLNVLLGYNAAGKSNIVEAISFLTDVIKGGVERAVQTKGRESFEDILYRKATTPVIRFELDLEAP
ncbi:MAG: AAA family ATPase, partial [Aliifodinibius sp.]|nr:AAA family ATPase [Fodinibius sp.]NIV13586.1 AAA family ATPase [Fodinibius sp.]NIY27339.1 AAA family ATPase [Fodinibius sp.]